MPEDDVFKIPIISGAARVFKRTNLFQRPGMLREGRDFEDEIVSEEKFRAKWKLNDEAAADPYWQAAYEYAAKYVLTMNEIRALGPLLELREDHNG